MTASEATVTQLRSAAGTWPPERQSLTDDETGATVIQWTRGPSKNQHLYFTTPSVTEDERWLIVISDRDGYPNLYAVDRMDGSLRRLSRNSNGLLKSYVYPLGGSEGLNKVSPCLDAPRSRLFFVRDGALYGVSLDEGGGDERHLCDLAEGWSAGFTHVSPDGKTICVPCTDSRALVDPAETQWEQMKRVAPRMAAEHLTSRICLIDTMTGRCEVAAEVPFWVTHVQFDPTGSGRIIFNREGYVEGNGDPMNCRIWCLETNHTFRPLCAQDVGEWRSHENWAPDGKSIVYHGGRGKHPYVAARSWEGELLREASFDTVACHHATGALDGRRLFVDKHDGFIALVDPTVQGSVTNLCRHSTSMKDQDTHAHPITTPSGRSVVFTSDRSGSCNVYEVLLREPVTK